MIYLQSLILEQICITAKKKSTDENWIRHGSISFSQFRTTHVWIYLRMCVQCTVHGLQWRWFEFTFMHMNEPIFWCIFYDWIYSGFSKICYQVCRRIAKLKTLYTYSSYTDIGNSFFPVKFVHEHDHEHVVYLSAMQHPIHLRNL